MLDQEVWNTVLLSLCAISATSPLVVSAAMVREKDPPTLIVWALSFSFCTIFIGVLPALFAFLVVGGLTHLSIIRAKARGKAVN